ncbi:hypothetical protein PBRA_004525 [Plasmodiophora brassicae]|uniref:Polysaccharide lyase 14 domain-containing protein n=1 Tax=Plasmodiophora brassicae TaxID=37360 RepID=A0A0G4IL44_PLABS|nr:hypothetical protein PBRA_004525 [Plasmodiophora brassicae]
MWRNATGAGAAYIYAVNNQAYCPSPTICPNSQVLTCCDPSYGDIVGRNFALLTGQWQKLAVMVDLQDGLTQVIHNGKVVISYIVKYGSIRLFNGIKFDTFFGGGSSSFSSPTTQYAYFRNFKLFVASTSRSYGQVKRATSKTANTPAKTSRKILASAQTTKKTRPVAPVASTRKRSHVVRSSKRTAPAQMPMTSKTESPNVLAVGSNSGRRNFPSTTSYVLVLLGLAVIYLF